MERESLRFWPRSYAQLLIPKVTISHSQTCLLELEDFLTKVTVTKPLDPIGPLSMDLKDPLSEDQINIIIVQHPTCELLKMSWLHHC